MDKGEFFYFRKRILNKILRMTVWRNQPERTLNTMKNEITYCAHPSEEKFLNCTKMYIEDLFGSVCRGANTVMVDQIVPPTNLKGIFDISMILKFLLLIVIREIFCT